MIGVPVIKVLVVEDEPVAAEYHQRLHAGGDRKSVV